MIIKLDVPMDVVVLGAIDGMAIGVLAVGLVLIYRASRVINLAHAELGAAAAAVSAALVRDSHLPYGLAVAIGVVGAGVVGVLEEVLVVRRLRQAPRAVSLIATVGLAELLLAGSIWVIDGIANRRGGYPVPFTAKVSVAGVTLGAPQLMILTVVPLLTVLLAAFLRYTNIGVAVRAASENREAAQLAAVPVDRIRALIWGLAGVLTAVVTLMLLAGQPIVGAEAVGPEVLFEALAACVLARFASLPRALVGGVAIGIVEQVVFNNWPSGGVRDLVLFAVVAAALLLPGRGPSGAASGDDEPSSWGRPLPRRWPGPAGWLLALMGFAAAGLVSLAVTNARTLTFTEIVAYAVLALSTTFVVGVAGHVSLGQVAFFGLGAAVSYQLSVSAGVPFWLAFLGAGVVASVASIVVGLPSLRLPGLFFAVTTLGFALAAQGWLLAQPWLVGSGVTAPRPVLGPVDLAGQRSYFVFALIVLAGAAWIVRNVLGSGPGRRVVALRDNEAAAAAFAVPVVRTRVLIFALAGFLAGIGGALYGHGLQNFSVSDFPVANPGLQIGAVDSLRIVAIAVIGGLGSISGAIAAAVLVVGVDQFTTSSALRLLVSSVGLLALLLALPGGLASVGRRVVGRA